MPKLSFWQMLKYYIISTRAVVGFQTIDKTYIENLLSVKEVVINGLPYSLQHRNKLLLFKSEDVLVSRD